MHDTLLTIDDLETATRALAANPKVSITPLGESRLGRPIEMISIGDGAHDALITGVPHPNEPGGAVTIERMIAALLSGGMPTLGYRWHFIKAIDPEGLALNGGWLKGPRTIGRYLSHFFRPALARQPETTFPLDMPDAHFTASTPENQAWQRAFALTRPALHASLHHCDYGGVFFSLSRALPGAIDGLEQALAASRLGVHDLDGDVMTVDRWTAAVSRYPSVPELVAQARAAGEAWAYPWTVGEMSPGFGEAGYGTLTLVPEVPLWDSAALHDETPSGITRAEHERRLDAITAAASDMAARYHDHFEKETALPPNAEECLLALAGSLKMMPSSETGGAGPAGDIVLTRRQFESMHTRQVLFALRTYGLLLSLANIVLAETPGHRIARSAAAEAKQALAREIELVESHSTLTPVPLATFTRLQLDSILACARALSIGR